MSDEQPPLGFRYEVFKAARFSPRVHTVTAELVDLAEWFDGPPCWRLKSLTYQERLRAQTLAAVAAQTSADQDPLEARIERAMLERCAYLSAASVQPAIDLPTARKLSEVHPVEFEALSNLAIQLTGQGQQKEEPAPGG